MNRMFRGNLSFIKIDVTILIYKTIDFSLWSGEEFYFRFCIIYRATSITSSLVGIL